jgi:cell division protein FtsL
MTTITASSNRIMHWASVVPTMSWKSMVVVTLFFSLWLSAFAVVYTTYSTRHTFAELQTLRQQHDSLFTEWTQLLLEQSAWTDAGSVQQLANEELQMLFPATTDIQFLVVQR